MQAINAPINGSINDRIRNLFPAGRLPIARTNLLSVNQANGGEDGTITGWNLYNVAAGGVTSSLEQKHEGLRSIKCVTSGTIADEGCWTSQLDVTPSNTYSASIWVYGASGNMLVALEERTAAGVYVNRATQDVTLNGEWQLVILSRAFGATGAKADIKVVTKTTAQVVTFYIDEAIICSGAIKAYDNSLAIAGSDTVISLDMQDGISGVARTNLIPATGVTFATGWVAYSGEGIVVTQGQALDDYTLDGATKVVGNGAGTNILKYYGTYGTSIVGMPYNYNLIVKNIGTTTIQIGLSGAQAGVVKVSVLAGETKEVEVNTIGNGISSVQVVFYTLVATDMLNVIAYHPMLSYGSKKAYDNSPAIAAVVPARLLDGSGRGNHAAVSGAVPVRGANGIEQSLDGVDDKFAISGDRIGVGDVTVECWIKPTSIGGGSAGRIISNVQFEIKTIATNTISVTSNNSSTAYTWANDIYTFGSWIHLVVVRKSSGLVTLYINGRLIGTADQNGGVPVLGSDTVIGNRAAGDRGFAGSIGGKVNVEYRIMSAAEIYARYKASAWQFGLRV
ncbi:MAG: LamG-like jellyroll fold domain-containing protein [Armatimonadota bacterium]